MGGKWGRTRRRGLGWNWTEKKSAVTRSRKSVGSRGPVITGATEAAFGLKELGAVRGSGSFPVFHLAHDLMAHGCELVEDSLGNGLGEIELPEFQRLPIDSRKTRHGQDPRRRQIEVDKAMRQLRAYLDDGSPAASSDGNVARG